MCDFKTPGFAGQYPGVCSVDQGTLARQAPAVPGPVQGPTSTGAPDPLDQVVREGSRVTASIGAQLTWDSFVRKFIYQPGAEVIQRQGELLYKSGHMTLNEAASWVNAQRNALVVATRDGRNSPLGKAYSELLKPRENLPGVEDFVERGARNGQSRKQALEAIIESSGRTRGAVNRLSLVFRVLGPATVVIEMAFIAYVVDQAPHDQQGRVFAREVGGTVGAASFGWGGAKVGCAAGSGIGVWAFGAGAAPGCAVGAVLGGFGFGYMGHQLGQDAGENVFDAASTSMKWIDESD